MLIENGMISKNCNIKCKSVAIQLFIYLYTCNTSSYIQATLNCWTVFCSCVSGQDQCVSYSWVSEFPTGSERHWAASHGILWTMCQAALVEMRWFNKRKPHQEAEPASLRMTGLNTANLQHSVFARGALISSFLLLETCFLPLRDSPPTLESQCSCTSSAVWPADALWRFKKGWGG